MNPTQRRLLYAIMEAWRQRPDLPLAALLQELPVDLDAESAALIDEVRQVRDYARQRPKHQRGRPE